VISDQVTGDRWLVISSYYFIQKENHFEKAMVRKTILLDDDLATQISLLSCKEDQSFSSSLRHILHIGLLALQNPELTAGEIKDILEARAELETGRIEELNIDP